MTISLKKRVLLLFASFCVVVAAAILSNCSDSTSPESETPVHKYREEAEKVALWTSGTLRPQEWLVQQIDHELDLIRTIWTDSVPEVSIPFTTPWIHNSVGVLVDTGLYIEIMTESNVAWKRLITDLDLTMSEPYKEWFPRYLNLTPKTCMHPHRIAEHFIGFPGVANVEAGWCLQGWEDWFVRVPSPKGAKYYFKHCTCPDIWNSYSYFEIDGDTAKYFDTHFECWDALDSVGWLRFENVIDSIEAARPMWVDTARAAIWKFTKNSEFGWSRGQ